MNFSSSTCSSDSCSESDKSRYREHLVVKGGALLAAYDLRRQTQDIDLQARSLSNDEATAAAAVRSVCALDVADGLSFDLDGTSTRVIRQGDRYEGVRVKVPARLSTARLVFKVDVSFGDPITPPAVGLSFPSLLAEPFHVVGYPLAAVLAEKLVTMLQLKNANTRDRDFGDVVGITRQHAMDASERFSRGGGTRPGANGSASRMKGSVEAGWGLS